MSNLTPEPTPYPAAPQDRGQPGGDCLVAPLEYAALGWPVFPVWWVKNGRCACGEAECERPGKHPMGKLAPNGRNSATTDPETIHRWWGQYPRANVAIATGPESGLVVVDVDPRNGGEKSFKKLPGIMPLTPTVHTGGGGEHYFLKYPTTGMKIKSKSEMGGFPGIDQKADGGYVVAPPSNHSSGGVYSWKIPPSETYPLAPVQDWLMTLFLKEDDEPQRTAEGNKEDTIPKKKRNTTLTSLAGTMRQRGMTEEEIEAALQAVNQGRCQPPLSKKEVVEISKSIGKYPQGNVEAQDEKEKKSTQQDVLLSIAAGVELFHTPSLEGYARPLINGHIETWAIKSPGMRRWLCHEFYKSQGRGPTSEALRAALEVLEARSQFDSPERPVWVRTAEHDGHIYLDMGNEAWEAIRVTCSGWDVVASPPVCFQRSRSMLPLPYPVKGGSVNELRPFLNVDSFSDFILLLAFILAAMRPSGPFPVLNLGGEQGTAKSTTARVIGSLVDPSKVPLRSTPKEVRDLMIAAEHLWLLGFDNLSWIPDWISDAFRMMATGGGSGYRGLYTDRDEIIFESMRPMIINGISHLIERQDLSDHSISVNLPQIREEDRLPEITF